MAQFAVIGLGSFGATVATQLIELGHDVIGIDSEKKYVENSLLPPGTITNQSRSKGTVVTSPGEFSITITKTPDVVEDIILPDEE